MNIDFNTFTEKSASAVQEAQNLARNHGQQEIDVWHLLLALVQQEGGIVPRLLERLDIIPSALELATERVISKFPKRLVASTSVKSMSRRHCSSRLLRLRKKKTHSMMSLSAPSTYFSGY
jgi:ATP-dependent Clp protease ATP-binding subunit ClpA